MTDPMTVALIGAIIITAIVAASLAALKGWQQWLDYKRLELASGLDQGLAPTGGRIEIADLKERVRKLEAIASGIEY